MEPIYQIFNLSQKQIKLMLDAIKSNPMLEDPSSFNIPETSSHLGSKPTYRITYGQNYFFNINKSQNTFICSYYPHLPGLDGFISWEAIFNDNNYGPSQFNKWLRSVKEDLEFVKLNNQFHKSYKQKFKDFASTNQDDLNGVFNEEELKILLPNAINDFLSKLNRLDTSQEAILNISADVKKLLERAQNGEIKNKKDFAGAFLMIIVTSVATWGLEKFYDQIYSWFVEAFSNPLFRLTLSKLL